MAQKKPAYEAPAPADDKKKALETALHQIEKNYGKGAVMRLGDRPEMNVDASHRFPCTGRRPRHRRPAPRPYRRDLRSGILRARRRLPCTFWRRHRSAAARLPLWMPSTRSIPFMRPPSA